ncbi:MAG: hypothetical protein ACOYLB_02650 [Phototrophicaceae bacterium]
MPTKNLFEWKDGAGGLIFSGYPNASSSVRPTVLERVHSDGGVAYVCMDGDIQVTEQVLDDFQELGAPSGYVVDLLADDDDTLYQRLVEASLIVLSSTRLHPALSHAYLLGAAIKGLEVAYQGGASLYVEGGAVSAFGKLLATDHNEVIHGFDWLKNALLVATHPNLGDFEKDMRAILDTEPFIMHLKLGMDSAIAFAPSGEFSLMGNREITMSLGTVFGDAFKTP